jgi:hypothetical protein
VFTRGHHVVSGMPELSSWRSASRRSWSRRWTAGSPWTTGGGWWSSTRPPSGSLAPPRPGDGPAADRAHHLPAAAPGASRRAGPLPGNRRGTVLGQHLELTAVRADGSELPRRAFHHQGRAAGAPVFTACLWDLTGRKQARAEQQAPGKRLRQSERLQSLGSRPGAWRTTSTTCSGSPCTTPLSSCSASPTTRPPAPTPNRSRAAAEQGAVQPAGARRAFRGADRRPAR